MISGASSVGYRDTNEDTYTYGDVGDIQYIGLFDGHGGSAISKMCREKLGDVLATTNYDPCVTLKELHRMTVDMPRRMGSTGVVGVIGGGVIKTAFIGDSSAYLVRDTTITPITRCHLASDPEEQKIVMGGGGEILNVMGIARVNGCLMMSRSIGDRHLVGIYHEPELTTHSLSGVKYVVFVTDGITDVLGPETIAKVTRETDGDPAALVKLAIEYRSMDNCTAVILTI